MHLVLDARVQKCMHMKAVAPYGVQPVASRSAEGDGLSVL